MTLIVGERVHSTDGQAEARRELSYTPTRVLKILSGRANRALSQSVGDILNIDLLGVEISNFKDGEIRVMLAESVRDKDVMIMQPTSPPVNENLQELLILIDTVSRASPREVTVVLPYFGYGRQDCKKHGREPITARLAAQQICAAGRVDRIVTLDLHTPKIQGFFDIPVGDHFYATMPLTTWIKEHWIRSDGVPETVIVSPDVGGVGRASAFAHELGLGMAIIDKRRPKANVAKATRLIGDVAGKIAVIVDDMIDTAGTVCEGARFLMEHGADAVYVAATHGLFSDPALERIGNSPISQIAITDSIHIPHHKILPNISVVSIADLFAEAIRRIFFGEEVSDMIGWFRGEE